MPAVGTPEVTTVPRSIQELLDHADELAHRFEDHAPAEGNEVPVAEYLLQRAALARARSEREVGEAVTAARSVARHGNGSAGSSVPQLKPPSNDTEPSSNRPAPASSEPKSPDMMCRSRAPSVVLAIRSFLVIRVPFEGGLGEGIVSQT